MGKVYLIGAGPGDPEFLTVKAARLLARATIVLHDSLVSREVLNLIPRTAQVLDVGKRCGQKLLTQDEINALMVFHAASHDTVIRLKGGDPLIFGRAGEEIEALRRAVVPFEIVPGITAAIGAAAAAGISLTDRRAASQIVITTYSRGSNPGTADPFAVAPQLDWAAISSSTTLVLYMPGADYAEVARRLREAGQPDDLPCVIVSNATKPQQQIRWTTVGKLAAEEKLPAPALLIVGRVATHQIQELAATGWATNRKEPASDRHKHTHPPIS
jgi:uroporphyrin-III C-methyltransferase